MSRRPLAGAWPFARSKKVKRVGTRRLAHPKETSKLQQAAAPSSKGGVSLNQNRSQVEREMSSLVKEDLQKRLFKPLAQKLCEFIEIEVSVQDRYYLCVSGEHHFLISFLNAKSSTEHKG